MSKWNWESSIKTLSVIPGTPENILVADNEHYTFDDEFDALIPNKRKIKISVKGETNELRKYRKLNRNSGLEYITNKGKVVKARSSEPLKNCRAKCNTIIDTE